MSIGLTGGNWTDLWYVKLSTDDHWEALIMFLLQIVKTNEFNLLKELSNGNSYRIHLASHEGRLVVVKTFEGPRAKQVSTFLCLLLLRRYI